MWEAVSLFLSLKNARYHSTMVKHDPVFCELFFPSGFADCDMKYSSTLTSPWTTGALRPTTIWGISRLLMSPLHVRSQTSHSQGSTPSEAAQWMRRPQEIQDSSWNNEITTWIILKDTWEHGKLHIDTTYNLSSGTMQNAGAVRRNANPKWMMFLKLL